MTVLTGNQIEFARLLTLRKMLKLEMYGMTRRGRSAYSILKKELGLTGNKQRVYDQVCAMCEEVLQSDEERHQEIVDEYREDDLRERAERREEFGY